MRIRKSLLLAAVLFILLSMISGYPALAGMNLPPRPGRDIYVQDYAGMLDGMASYFKNSDFNGGVLYAFNSIASLICTEYGVDDPYMERLENTEDSSTETSPLALIVVPIIFFGLILAVIFGGRRSGKGHSGGGWFSGGGSGGGSSGGFVGGSSGGGGASGSW